MSHKEESGVIIRTVREEDLPLILQWCQDEGWDTSSNYLKMIFSHIPGEFFAAELDGNIVGCCCAKRLGSTYGVFGMAVVNPVFRGRGIGRRLIEHGARLLEAHLGVRNCILFSREDYKSVYARKGYPFSCGRVLNYRGIPNMNRLSGYDLTVGGTNREVIPISEVPMEDVYAYDRCVHPVERRGYWEALLEYRNNVILAVVEDGKVVGIGGVEQSGDRFKLAPLYGNGLDVVLVLVKELLMQMMENAKNTSPASSMKNEHVAETSPYPSVLLESIKRVSPASSMENRVVTEAPPLFPSSQTSSSSSSAAAAAAAAPAAAAVVAAAAPATSSSLPQSSSPAGINGWHSVRPSSKDADSALCQPFLSSPSEVVMETLDSSRGGQKIASTLGLPLDHSLIIMCSKEGDPINTDRVYALADNDMSIV